MKWKTKKSKEQYSRFNEFSDQFFDAIYGNDFELAKILIDDGKVNVNIKNDCGDTPLIAVCQQTTLQNEEETVVFINYLWQGGSKFHSSNKSGKTAMNYAESNGLTNIVENLKYVQWMSLFDNLCNVLFKRKITCVVESSKSIAKSLHYKQYISKIYSPDVAQMWNAQNMILREKQSMQAFKVQLKLQQF